MHPACIPSVYLLWVSDSLSLTPSFFINIIWGIKVSEVDGGSQCLKSQESTSRTQIHRNKKAQGKQVMENWKKGAGITSSKEWLTVQWRSESWREAYFINCSNNSAQLYFALPKWSLAKRSHIFNCILYDRYFLCSISTVWLFFDMLHFCIMRYEKWI